VRPTQQAITTMWSGNIGGVWTMRNRCEDKEVEGKEEQLERREPHQGS
jgi:hypothetical protein